jgi:hypothetical protein
MRTGRVGRQPFAWGGPALLVATAAPRLRAIGIEVAPATVDAPLHRLYELIASSDSVEGLPNNNEARSHIGPAPRFHGREEGTPAASPG